MKKTVYQRIIEAGKQGKMLRLTSAEVQTLAADTAIVHCAANDDEAANPLTCTRIAGHIGPCNGYARRETPFSYCYSPHAD